MQESKKLFNQRAHNWDRQHPEDPEQIRAILRVCGMEPGGLVLDVGCGTGVLEPYLLAYSPRRVIAIDYARNMVEVARQKFPSPVVDYVCADIFDLEDIQCDYAFLYNAFPHFSDPQRLLGHLATLLKPRGRLVISHAQGKAADVPTTGPLPLAAESLLKIMRPLYQVDALVDNKALFLVSGLRL